MLSISMDLQLKISDIIIELDDTGDATQDSINEYFVIAQNDLAYTNYMSYCEMSLVKQLMTYFSSIVMESPSLVSECLSKFTTLIDKVYIAYTSIETPKDLYINLCNFGLRNLLDEQLALTALYECNTIVDTTSNTVLKIEIKRKLLTLYLRNPSKFKEELKGMTSELKTLNTIELDEKDIDVKSIL